MAPWWGSAIQALAFREFLQRVRHGVRSFHLRSPRGIERNRRGEEWFVFVRQDCTVVFAVSFGPRRTMAPWPLSVLGLRGNTEPAIIPEMTVKGAINFANPWWTTNGPLCPRIFLRARGLSGVPRRWKFEGYRGRTADQLFSEKITEVEDVRLHRDARGSHRNIFIVPLPTRSSLLGGALPSSSAPRSPPASYFSLLRSGSPVLWTGTQALFFLSSHSGACITRPARILLAASSKTSPRVRLLREWPWTTN